MKVIAEPTELDDYRGGALVPTMGALHEGHLALITRVKAMGLPVVVSVFVNPTQFNDPADLERYPRQLESDAQKADGAGADAVFAPQVESVYPPSEPVPVPPLPDVATTPGLEDRARPGHFAGVCQVVARLFDLVMPKAAVFGEKDFQQLRVIEALTQHERSRWPELQIVPHPTMREPDGLAMSSRNVRLSSADRERALGLSRALHCAEELASPGYPVRRIEEAMRALLVRHLLEVEYAVVREAKSLMPIESIPEQDHSSGCRALIAARAGDVRLIDNVGL